MAVKTERERERDRQTDTDRDTESIGNGKGSLWFRQEPKNMQFSGPQTEQTKGCLGKFANFVSLNHYNI